MPHLSSEFEEHYRSHFDFTWRTLRRQGVPSTELDDAAQEVFLVLLRRRASIPPELPIRAWLFGVIRRIAWRYRRSDTRRKLLREAVDKAAHLESDVHATTATIEYPDHRPDQLHDIREAARLVECFLAELTPIQAEVFILAELEELSGKEIAEHLGVNQNTVWSRLRLARCAFDRRFAPIRAESARIYQRSSTKDRDSVLSLSRRGHRPNSEDRRRVGALLGLPGFGAIPQGGTFAPQAATASPFEAAAITATTTTGIPLAGFAGAAAIAALVIGIGLSKKPVTPVSAETTANRRTTERVETSPAEKRGPATPADNSNSNSNSNSQTWAPQRPLPSPPTLARQASQRSPKSAAKKQPRSPLGNNTPTAGNSSLGAEYDLLTAAREALANDDAKRCLALTDNHRRDYPDGILTQERDGLQIAALCQLGRDLEATRLAEHLAEHLDDPRSIRRFTAACKPSAP